MKLRELLVGLEYTIVSGSSKMLDRDIKDVTQDSRMAALHSVFLAMPSLTPGSNVHGVDFIHSAVAQGSNVVLMQPKDGDHSIDLANDVLLLAIPALRSCYGDIARRLYGVQASQPLAKLIATTGTDGKTSVSNMIAQMMNDDQPCAMIGTIGNGFLDNLQVATHTTPDAIGLQRLLRNLSDQGAGLVAVEASSHALDQQRLGGADVHTAVMTNVGRDHLDYHGTVEAYAEAKQRLFKRPELSLAIVNVDDAHGQQWLQDLAEKSAAEWIAYGVDTPANADVLQQATHFVLAKSIATTRTGFVVEVVSSWGEGQMILPLLGEFNVANALAVLSVMLGHGVEFQAALKKLATIKTVVGRMEAFDAETRPLVVVDYAHTPQAVSAALAGIRPHAVAANPEARILAVFGCGGDRDAGKRPLMGAAAESGADLVIVTNDNPRSEAPEVILQDILRGMTSEPVVELDRVKAIKKALSLATENDVVLVAGKGHEDYQIIGEERLHYSDRDTVMNLLEIRNANVS